MNTENKDHLSSLDPADPTPDETNIQKCDDVPSEDEVDKASIFSLYMEHDFRYIFQHPVFRLFIAYFVTFCNFLIYAEDPVAHSEQECFIPVVGNAFSFILTRYASNAWSLLKVICWLTALIVGLMLGKFVFHKLIFNRFLRLKMFYEDQGSWMVMFFTTIFSLFVFSYVYNLFLLGGGSSTLPYRINDRLGIKNSWFMKAAACGTWCGDFFTAWMVTDIIFQEKLYPKWGQKVRHWWNRGYNRIILFWVITLTTSSVVILVITTDWIQWDKLNRNFLPTNEISRSFLASFILVFDLVIVMQDWDFPHFIKNMDIKLPGLNKANISFEIPKFLNKMEKWKIHITGKWFNYGILMIVIILDLNMWKNQIFYSPFEFGQYTGPDGRIYSVRDQFSLRNFNETFLNYAWRLNHTNPLTNRTYISDDLVVNTRFYGFSLAVRCTAFIPSLLVFLAFGVFIWMFGRWKPTENDPYGGRLKKHKKRMFRFRSRFGFAQNRGHKNSHKSFTLNQTENQHKTENT